MPTLAETRDGSSFPKQGRLVELLQLFPLQNLERKVHLPLSEASSPDAKVRDNARDGFHKPVPFTLIHAELLDGLLHLYMGYKDLQREFIIREMPMKPP